MDKTEQDIALERQVCFKFVLICTNSVARDLSVAMWRLQFRQPKVSFANLKFKVQS